MPISEAKHRSNEKWNASAYDQIVVRVKKGRKQVIQEEAEKAGISVNAFIGRLIEAEIARLSIQPGDDFHIGDE